MISCSHSTHNGLHTPYSTNNTCAHTHILQIHIHTTHTILHKQYMCPHTHTTDTHTHRIHYLRQLAASPTHAKTYPMHQPHVQWDLRPFQHFVASVTSPLVSAETHPLTKLIYIPNSWEHHSHNQTVPILMAHSNNTSVLSVLVQGLCIEHCNHSRDMTVTYKRLQLPFQFQVRLHHSKTSITWAIAVCTVLSGLKLWNGCSVTYEACSITKCV